MASPLRFNNCFFTDLSLPLDHTPLTGRDLVIAITEYPAYITMSDTEKWLSRYVRTVGMNESLKKTEVPSFMSAIV